MVRVQGWVSPRFRRLRGRSISGTAAVVVFTRMWSHLLYNVEFSGKWVCYFDKWVCYFDKWVNLNTQQTDFRSV
jgi:hypothetical protein